MDAQVREYPYDLALKNELELYEISKGFDDMAIVNKRCKLSQNIDTASEII